MVLDAALLSTLHYKVRIKIKWRNLGNRAVPSPTPQCSSYWKGSLRVTLLYGCQLYFTLYTYHHHHHIALVARISLTLSRHSSLSFIALGRSSGQHPVSSHSCWMYVRAGRPAFARPCVEVHKSTSLMSSSLLLQQCPACLARLTWIVFVIGGRWQYSWCLVGCRCQDLYKNKFTQLFIQTQIFILIRIYTYLHRKKHFAQLAGAVEYTDCTSSEG